MQLNNEDKKLYEKFERMMKNKPSESEALEFWSKLSIAEYDRLIYLFEQNEIDRVPKEIRLKLAVFFKKIKEKLSQAGIKN